MAEYRAKPGQEDRHGEMTGAITINMMLCMPLVMLWAIVIGPLLDVSSTVHLGVAIALAVILPVVCLLPSRWIWAHVSDFMDRSQH